MSESRENEKDRVVMLTNTQEKRCAAVPEKEGEPLSESRVLGYIKQAGEERDYDMERSALRSAGVEEEGLLVGKEENAKFRHLMDSAKAGDLILVYTLYDVCSSLKELFAVVTELHEKGVGLRSISEEWFDFSPAAGGKAYELYEVFSKLYVVHKFLAAKTTVAGLKRAKANGKKLGRPRGIDKDKKMKIEMAVQMYNNSSMTVSEICALMQLTPRSFYRYIQVEGLSIERRINKY